MSDSTRTERYLAAIDGNGVDLSAYCERRLGVDGADALADTMLAAWRNIAKMPVDPVEARMWLFTIARGAVLNARRAAGRRAALSARLKSIRQRAYDELQIDAGTSTDLLAGLADDDAELLRLIHWEGFGVGEAAQILGLKAATARTRYARAKATLREALADDEDEDESLVVRRNVHR